MEISFCLSAVLPRYKEETALETVNWLRGYYHSSAMRIRHLIVELALYLYTSSSKTFFVCVCGPLFCLKADPFLLISVLYENYIA